MQNTSDLTQCNSELVDLIDRLKEHKAVLDHEIVQHQEDKIKFERDISILKERLKDVDSALQQKVQSRAEYEKTIRDTEMAYNSIVESSRKLLHLVKDRTGISK